MPVHLSVMWRLSPDWLTVSPKCTNTRRIYVEMSFFSDGWSFGRSFTYSCPPSFFHCCCCCCKILEKFIFWFYYFDINKIYGPQTESLPNINITYNKVLIISETAVTATPPTTTPAITIKQKRNNINNITRTDERMDDLSYLFLVGHGLLFFMK